MHANHQGGAAMSRERREDLPMLTDSDYAEFGAFLQSACGIHLGDNKQYLVSTRIRRILVEHRLPDLATLTRRIKSGADRLLRQQVIDAMTTNETFWFRDAYPFDYLKRSLIPDLAQNIGGRKIRIWCAACSTGQEPYSVSIVFEEALRGRFVNKVIDGEILATDVSNSVVHAAEKGQYDKLSLMRGLNQERIGNFFHQENDDRWLVNEKIRSRVKFRAVNLQESYYLLGKFDIIFCRNVLIYFTSELKIEILKKMHAALNPGGVLFLGASEGISGLSDYFQMINCQPGVAYRALPVHRRR